MFIWSRLLYLVQIEILHIFASHNNEIFVFASTSVSVMCQNFGKFIIEINAFPLVLILYFLYDNMILKNK